MFSGKTNAVNAEKTLSVYVAPIVVLRIKEKILITGSK